MSENRSKLAYILSVVTAGVQRRPRFVSLGYLALSALLLYYAVTNIGVNTATTDMFSEDLGWFRQFNEFRFDFPPLEDNVLVVLEGAIPEYVDSAQEKLARRLSENTDVSWTVLALETSEFFKQNGLLFLTPEELNALGDRLASVQPIVGRLSQRPHLAGFFSLLTDMVQQDTAATGELDLAAERLTAVAREAASGTPQPISWQELFAADVDTADSYRRVVLVDPDLNYEGAEPRAEVLRQIRASTQRLPEVQAGRVEVKLTGSLALQQEELSSVSQGIIQGAIITLLLVIFILMLALRSWRLFAASLITLLCGLSVTAAFTAVAIGYLNLISVAFAVLYIGLGIDFAIHYCLRYRELMGAGLSHAEAINETSLDTGVALVLCAITTAIGFFAFVPTDFSGVAELGLISGFGMFASLVSSLILLPALIHLFGPPHNALDQHTPPLFASIGHFVNHHLRTVHIVLVFVAAAVLYLAANARFDSNPLNLRDPDSESVVAYIDLLEDVQTTPLTLSVVVTEETIAALAQELSALPEVAEVRQIHDFVPPRQEEKLAILSDQALLLGAPRPLTLAPPEPARDLVAIREAIPVLREADGAGIVALADALQQWLDDMPAGAEEAELAELSEATLDTFPLNWNRIVAGFGAQAFTVADLPPDIRDLWLSRNALPRLEVVPAMTLTSMERIGRFIEAVRSVAPGATGVPSMQYYAGETVVASFIQAIITAVVCVFLLLLILLRDLRQAVAVIVPLMLATAFTAASTGVLGVPFNFANVITLPLIIGVGVDNGVHMVKRHMQSQDKQSLMTSSTARAILYSTLTTTASFGSLAFSQHPGTASMGILLSVGMVASLFAALFVVPALLPHPETNP